MNQAYDIAVIGSGFSGSMMAMIARRLGYSVVLIEKHTHPRVVIGESSTPLSNLLLEELADTYDLPMLRPLTKWGSWQRLHPELSCGLKRGFSFFHHDLRGPTVSSADTESQLLVAASPHDEIADTHWFRADVDHFLVKEAQTLGVVYTDRSVLERCSRHEDYWTLEGCKATVPLSIHARFLIDATGPRGFLHHALQLSEVALPGYPATCSLYCHFRNVDRLTDLPGSSYTQAPFPVDDAAVHHVFEAGWIWMLRFNNGWTSAGVAVTEEVSSRWRLSDGEEAWHRVLASLPRVKRLFKDAIPATPFTYLPNLAFCSQSTVGDGWVMLPAAAGFIDPLLSTGFPLTLLGIQRVANALSATKSLSKFRPQLELYADQTRKELTATARLIGSLYRNMGNFSVFRNLSLLYFVAASYSEVVRRLGKAHFATSFLLAEDTYFAPVFNHILDIADQPLNTKQQDELERLIYRLIEQYDVAGLAGRPINHCYPVLAADLFKAATKLGATQLEIELMLRRSGLSETMAFQPS